MCGVHFAAIMGCKEENKQWPDQGCSDMRIASCMIKPRKERFRFLRPESSLDTKAMSFRSCWANLETLNFVLFFHRPAMPEVPWLRVLPAGGGEKKNTGTVFWPANLTAPASILKQQGERARAESWMRKERRQAGEGREGGGGLIDPVITYSVLRLW